MAARPVLLRALAATVVAGALLEGAVLSAWKGSFWYLKPDGTPGESTYHLLLLSMVLASVLALGAFAIRSPSDAYYRRLLVGGAIFAFCLAWIHVIFIWLSHTSQKADITVSTPPSEESRASEVLSVSGAESLVQSGTHSSCAQATLGEVLLKQGDARRALEAFRAATRTDPACIDAQLGVAMSMEALGDRDGADAHLRALLLQYDDADIKAFIYYTIGVLAIRAGDRSAEVRAYEKCTTLRPEVQRYWTWLGIALISAGRFEEAERALQRSIGISNRGKSAAIAYVGLAELAHRRGASEAVVYALLVESMRATWVKPPDHLLPYLRRTWPIPDSGVSAQK